MYKIFIKKIINKSFFKKNDIISIIYIINKINIIIIKIDFFYQIKNFQQIENIFQLNILF